MRRQIVLFAPQNKQINQNRGKTTSEKGRWRKALATDPCLMSAGVSYEQKKGDLMPFYNLMLSVQSAERILCKSQLFL